MVYKRSRAGEDKRAASIAKLLLAAERLFSEKGFQKTTMQEIVREAESSIGNLYFYFANKDELLRTLIEDELLAVYAASDAVAQRIAAGPARLATMVFTTAEGMLGPDARLGKLLRHASPNPVTQRVAVMNRERVGRYLAENLTGLTELELRYAKIMWSGGGVAMTTELALSEGEADFWPAVEFVVRWNLSAMGIPESEINEAIDIAYEALETADAT
jgi:AcrR family transcriptional regulator